MNSSNDFLQRILRDGERLRLMLFSLFAFCVLAISLTFFVLSIGRPYLGIIFSMDERGWMVESVDGSERIHFTELAQIADLIRQKTQDVCHQDLSGEM